MRILILILVISSLCADTIKYRKQKLIGPDKHKVIENTIILEINQNRLRYKKNLGVLGIKYGYIECGQIDEIFDFDNNIIDFSCSENKIFNEDIDLWPEIEGKQKNKFSNLRLGGALIMSSGVLALLNENTASSLKNKDIVADLALLSLSLGGLFISLEIKDLSANKP